MSASDSSEEEDVSRFKEAVDTSFINVFKQDSNINSKLGNNATELSKKSGWYLEEATHYNDVKFPKEQQMKIGKKISTIIDRKFEFVEIKSKIIKRKIKGGVKLFSDSDNYLSCHEAEDQFTKIHNIKAKKLQQRKENTNIEKDKIKSVALSGEYVLSREEIKCWKSRRKEKVFKYKSNGRGAFIAVE